MSAAAVDVEPHRIQIIRGDVIGSDYQSDTDLERTVYVARCSCGWSVVRQLLSAVTNQTAKHRRQVA